MSVIEVNCIDHLTIVVKDLDASRRFYLDLLGMVEMPRPNFDFEGAWFQAGKTLLHLIKQHENSGVAGTLSPEGTRTTRTHHFAFSVPDANQAWEKLQQSGVELDVITPPKFRPDGAVQVFLADPDGHIVELSSEPKS